MQQLSLTFEPGMAQRSRSLREHLATRIYAQGPARVATIIDCSPSHLSEKLAGIETSDGRRRYLSVDELEAYIAGTGDTTPILYLIDKFMRDPKAQQAEALQKLAELGALLPGLLAAAGMAPPTPKRGR